MTKIRILIFALTIAVVLSIGTLVFFYAKGYRLDTDTNKISPNGLLVIKSSPDGAQVYVNGELKTATDATIPLIPGTYDVSVKKEGFISWNKRLVIEKEIVTEASAHLFKTAPSLSAITFSGIKTVIPSRDLTKIGYSVVGNGAETENQGLWIVENVNLPLGFSRDPKRITDGNLSDSTWAWSPDGREILLTTSRGSYLLDTSTFTSQAQRVNVTVTKFEILEGWEEEAEKKDKSQIDKLPEELVEIFENDVSSAVFSPDEEMVVYTASSSATLEKDLIQQLPGSSTQKEQRSIKPGKTYVYDLKEDKNFLIEEGDGELIIEGGFANGAVRRISWYPSSRHLVLAEENKITIVDHDGTNRQEVYTGSYITPHAYPTLSLDRLIVLTNLGANDSPPNLYSLSLK
ncbi:PEGA domain-containing protein [Patescibacteria group bacterium]